jgi:uncharacterized HAD superfamily protein
MNRWMLDFDGVLADLNTPFIEAVNKRFGTNYTAEEENSWNFWREQGREISSFVWEECFGSEDWFYHNVGPYPGVIEALADLLSDTATDMVYIVTARPRNHERWIKDWLLDLSTSLVPLYHIPVRAVGHEPKIEVCKRLDLNIVIEDKPDNLSPFNPLRTSLFLVNRPWNAFYREPGHIQRVDSLQGAINQAVGVMA